MNSSSCNDRLLAVIFVCLLWPCMLSGQINWQTLNSSSYYDNRDEHGYVELNGKFYLIGGAYMGRPQVQEYNPATNSWTNKATVPVDFHHLQAVAYNNQIWVMCAWYGGYSAEQNLAQIYSYNPAIDTWTQRFTVPANRRRGSAGVVVYNDKFYILGGNSGGHGPQGDVKNWVDVYDPHANNGAGSWTSLANMPVGRDHFQAVGKNGKIYAIGGRDSGTAGNFFVNIRSQVDIYDIASNSWTTLPASANLPTLRAGSCNVIMDDEVLVLLGVGNARENEFKKVEAFNINTQTWRTLPDAPHARSGTQAVPFGRDIYVASGIGSVYGGTDLYSQDKLHIPAPGPIFPSLDDPIDAISIAGGHAIFRVIVSNATNPSYQWQRQWPGQSWQNIAGAMQESLTLNGVTEADDSSLFRVIVTHSIGTLTSDAAMLTVRCDGVFIGNTDPIVIEAEHFHESFSRNGQSWQVTSQTGSVGSMLEAGPNLGANFNTNYLGQSPETQYDIHFSQGGTYYVWLRTYSQTYEDNSCHAALDSVVTGTADRITYDTYQQWGWTNQTMDGHAATFVVPGPGIHSLHLWMREDGVRIDRILLTQNSSYVPAGNGPAETDACASISTFPVEWKDFDAFLQDNEVHLTWTTVQERQNSGFIIQKSADQSIWTEINFISGVGNSDAPTAYSSIDQTPWLGTSYYRLKQVDLDGQFSFSKVVEVSFEQFFSRKISIYPNPLNDDIASLNFGHDGETSHIIVRNLVGAEVKHFIFQSSQAGIANQKLNLGNLQTGIYLVQVENRLINKSLKLVIR